jgi:N-acetylglucosamine-6-phosphate deacetylase
MGTLAPEYPHGVDAVRRFVAAGAIAAVGHTDATYDQVRAAIEAGASCSTHLYNAMRPVNHREPGPIVALTEDERVTNELILDGVHVHHSSAAFAVRAAEGRVVLVTDAMTAAAGEDGEYMLGDLAVLVVDGVARLVDGGAIAGSTLTLDLAVKFAIEQVGMSPEAAFAAATSTPARMLGATDRGRLEAGLRADLCHMNDALTLTAVWSGGVPVAL